MRFQDTDSTRQGRRKEANDDRDERKKQEVEEHAKRVWRRC